MAELNRFFIVGFLIYFLTEQTIGGPGANDIESCSSLCRSTFQGTEQDLCTRGCRLMSVIGYFHGPLISTTELKDSCLGACAEAYANTNASACAFGCQSQIPMVEMQRDKMAEMTGFDEDDEGLFGLSQRFAEYSNRVMNCMLDQINHQVSVGWVSITSYVSADNNNRIIIVRGSPGQIFQPFNELKTSGYIETNLAAHDGGATPELKQSQLVRMDSAADQSPNFYKQPDWLSCQSAKTHLSKVSILMILFTMFLVLIWFFIGACFPATREPTRAHPKLSIYGDLESLAIYNEKKVPLFTSDRHFSGNAPALPVKIQEI